MRVAAPKLTAEANTDAISMPVRPLPIALQALPGHLKRRQTNYGALKIDRQASDTTEHFAACYYLLVRLNRKRDLN